MSVDYRDSGPTAITKGHVASGLIASDHGLSRCLQLAGGQSIILTKSVMRSNRSAWVIAGLLIAAWLGYVSYTFTPFYRNNFKAKFDRIKAGDSFEQVVDVLGKPTHYCPIYSFDYFKSTRQLVAVTEIYRIGTYDFGVEFPYTESGGGGQYGGDGLRGPVTKTVVTERSICPGGDNRHK